MFFKKKNKLNYPKERGLYAFTRHKRGDFLLFIGETSSSVLEFIQLPDLYKISLTTKEFSIGIQDNLLDFVEQIPEEVLEVTKANVVNSEKFT